MFRIQPHLGAALALVLLLPTSLTAQERDRDRDRGRDVFIRRMPDGPRLGLLLDPSTDEKTDRLGARVERVMPGTPAEKAGIESGDIITKFNGTSLAASEDDDDDPAERLSDLARRLEPGDTARLEYRRDGKTHQATLVARELGYARYGMRVPSLKQMMPAIEGMHGFDFFVGRWHGLQLTDLNPELGEYFGTSDGVLVTAVSGDSAPPVRPGDVILSIDGRAPQSVAHAHRIMASYAAGETVKLDVMRKQQRQSVTWTVPERMRDGRPPKRVALRAQEDAGVHGAGLT